VSFYLINEYLNASSKEEYNQEQIDSIKYQLNLFFSDEFKDWNP